MWKTMTVFLLLLFPILANASTWVMPNGKVFAELTTPTGVSIWQEIIGAIVIPAHASEPTLGEQINQYIVAISQVYNVSALEMLEVSNCESDWQKYPDNAIVAVGDKGKANGLWQFWEGTFNKWKKESGNTSLDYSNWQDQTKLAGWAFSKGYKAAWSCYVKMFIEKKW